MPVWEADEPRREAVSPAFQGPGRAPTQPLPWRHSRILVGRRAGLPRGPRNDSGEMLWSWVVVWLRRGERAVHRAPSPASGGGPQLIQSREEGQVEGEGGPGRGGRGKEKMEERRGEERGKEQMEGKEGRKEERKVKTGGRGHRQSRGRGKPAQERAPAPSPSLVGLGGPQGMRTGWRQGSRPSGKVGEGRV